MASKNSIDQTVCTDKNCPIHGSLSTRGSVKKGLVRSKKLASMAVVEIPILSKVKKYERSAKRRSRIHVHVPSCLKVKEGDDVEISECKKISKTKSFVVTKVL